MAQILEFANFTLTFGPKKVLADFLDEIVVPAFTDTTFRRNYGKTTYLFKDVSVINLGTKKAPEPAIAGRFIKDTVIRREQILDHATGQLVKDEKSLRTSPSVTFTLILSNHKLLYLRETSNAPGIDSFRSTVANFLPRKYFVLINTEYERRRASLADEKKSTVTKKALVKELLPPLVEIIPIASEASVVDFISRFKTLSTVKVDLGPVNAEIHNDPFFTVIRNERDAVGAQRAVLIETNSEGLNKTAVAKQLKAISQEATASVYLGGKTPDDKKFEVDNHEMRLQLPMPNLPPDVEGKAVRSFIEYEKAVADKTIIVGKPDAVTAAKIRGKFLF